MWTLSGVGCMTFHCAKTLPHRNDDVRHVQDVSGHLEREISLRSPSRHHHHHLHPHHLERERLVELGRNVTLDDVSSSRLDDGTLTHQAHLGVEICMSTHRFQFRFPSAYFTVIDKYNFRALHLS